VAAVVVIIFIVVLLVNRSSIGKWFAQSRAVAYLIPGVCLLLFAVLITVSASATVCKALVWSHLMRAFNECVV